MLRAAATACIKREQKMRPFLIAKLLSKAAVTSLTSLFRGGKLPLLKLLLVCLAESGLSQQELQYWWAEQEEKFRLQTRSLLSAQHTPELSRSEDLRQMADCIFSP